MIGKFLTGCGGAAFIGIGLGAIVAPTFSSKQYGLPVSGAAERALIRAIGARDLVLGIIVTGLLIRGDRAALELVLPVSILAAVADASAVFMGRDDAKPRDVTVHVAGAAALLAAYAGVRRAF